MANDKIWSVIYNHPNPPNPVSWSSDSFIVLKHLRLCLNSVRGYTIRPCIYIRKSIFSLLQKNIRQSYNKNKISTNKQLKKQIKLDLFLFILLYSHYRNSSLHQYNCSLIRRYAGFAQRFAREFAYCPIE